ncbi:hypothetical protein D9M68_609360 [compost metagenome]
MEKQYHIGGGRVQVRFRSRLICIAGTESLLQLLQADHYQHTQQLVVQIKADYLLWKGEPLKIRDRSLMVEIWGHLYASRFARFTAALIRLRLIRNFSRFIQHRSETIDCGERGIDHNRLFWDMLSHFNPLILKFLPDKKN